MKATIRMPRIAAATAALVLAGAASAQSFSVDFSSSRLMGAGQAGLLIENIRIIEGASNTGYNVVFRLDPTTLQLIPESAAVSAGVAPSNCAAVNVNVYNAGVGTSARIRGASVTIGSRTTFTGSTGVAGFNGITEGTASVSVTAVGYSAGAQSATVTCTGTHTIEVGLQPVQ